MKQKLSGPTEAHGRFIYNVKEYANQLICIYTMTCRMIFCTF